jgi:hypothetical protein
MKTTIATTLACCALLPACGTSRSEVDVENPLVGRMPDLRRIFPEPRTIWVSSVDVAPCIEVAFQDHASGPDAAATKEQTARVMNELTEFVKREIHALASQEQALVSFVDDARNQSEADLQIACVLDAIEVQGSQGAPARATVNDVVADLDRGIESVSAKCHLELVIDGRRESAADAVGTRRFRLPPPNAPAPSATPNATGEPGTLAPERGSTTLAVNAPTKEAIQAAIQGAWGSMWNQFVRKGGPRKAPPADSPEPAAPAPIE